MPALRCPDCHGTLRQMDEQVSCPACGSVFPVNDGVISFLAAAPDGVESDYRWNYRADPRISPLTEARWRLMTQVMDRVAVGSTVVAVGGGGEHWPARQLDGRVEEYVVVDTSAQQLARQWYPRGARGTALLAAGERLPLLDRSADTVEMWGVLDHFVDPTTAVAEAARILRPGGNVVIGLGNDGSWYRRLAGRFAPGDSHAHRHHFDLRAIERLLAEAFVVTRVETLAYLRLPVRLERTLGKRLGPTAQERFVRASDAVLRKLLGPHAGGMIVVDARATRALRAGKSRARS